MRCRIWQKALCAHAGTICSLDIKSSWMLLWASVILCTIADLLRPLTCFKKERCVCRISVFWYVLFPISLCTIKVGSKVKLPPPHWMWRREEFLALPTEKPNCPAPQGSSVLQSRAFNPLMADVVYIDNRQRVVTEFLTTEGSSPIKIHRRLGSVCNEDAIDVGLERWKGNWWQARSGRPGTAANSGRVKVSYWWNSWRELSQSIQSDMYSYRRS